MGTLLKRVFGVVFATEDDKNIQLRGVKAGMVARDIRKIWATNKIGDNMFTALTSSLIAFPKFFAPDFHYILKQLAANRRAWTDVRVIHKAIRELEENTWLKRLTEDHEGVLDASKLALFHKAPLPHQKEFYDIYNDRVPRYGLSGYLLSAAAGTGKTLTCLQIAEMVHADTVVMVVPKNAVYKVWSKALKEEYKTPQDHWIASDNLPYKGQRFILGHYEALEKIVAAAKSKGGQNPVVILDESHNMNETDSLRTQLFVQLCQGLKSRHVLWSSGTPIKALGYEAIPLLRTIDPLFTPDVEDRFKKIYGRNAQRALDILRNRMGMISYRVEKKEVVDNKATVSSIKVKLPNGNDYTLETVRAEMQKYITERLEYYKNNMCKYETIYEEALKFHEQSIGTEEGRKALKLYRSYIKHIQKYYDTVVMAKEAKYCNDYELKVIIPSLPKEMKNEFKNARSVVKYVRLKVMGEALGGILGRKRMQCHLDMIPYMNLEEVVENSEKKTVIFTSYVEVAKQLDAYFRKADYQPVLIYGETNSNLSGLVTQFETKEEANPAIATYQSLSTAVPLIVANTAIFVNQPFRDHEKVQAQARVDRLGQDTAVHFVDVLLDTGDQPNVSTRSKDILDWSKEQIAAIMGSDYSGGAAKTLDTYYAGVESFAMEEYFVATSNPFDVAFESINDELFDIGEIHEKVA